MKLGGGEWTNEDGGGGGRIFPRGTRFMATVIYESRKFEGRTFVESWTITQGQTALQIHDTILSAPASSGEWLRLERDHRSWTHVLCLFDDFWNFLRSIELRIVIKFWLCR